MNSYMWTVHIDVYFELNNKKSVDGSLSVDFDNKQISNSNISVKQNIKGEFVYTTSFDVDDVSLRNFVLPKCI